jgi:Protein of unknown function (DUF3800)
MRLLYLDDSGKTDPNHNSRFVVYAGISVKDTEWTTLHRRITGAKARYFPKRGNPNKWELKSTDFLTRNAWQRRNNRQFCFEVVRILERSGCSVYSAAAEKARAMHQLDETWLVPLMYQRITAKFLDEIDESGDGTGSMVCDWTSYKLDHHISACVGSYAVSRGHTQVIGGVSYASSHSFTTIQIADLIAGAYRIWYEGGTRLNTLIAQLTGLQYDRAGQLDVEGFPMASVFRIF